MKTCGTCDYYRFHENCEEPSGGCTNKRIASGSQHNPDNVMVTFGGFDGYGDYINIHFNFGCILHEDKKVT